VIQNTTITDAEIKAILEAMRYYQRDNSHTVIIETDSLGSKNMIQKQWKPPCEVTNMIEEIQEYIQTVHAHISHTFREGNRLVDFLANHFLNYQSSIYYTTFLDLPTQARKILNSK